MKELFSVTIDPVPFCRVGVQCGMGEAVREKEVGGGNTEKQRAGRHVEKVLHCGRCQAIECLLGSPPLFRIMQIHQQNASSGSGARPGIGRRYQMWMEILRAEHIPGTQPQPGMQRASSHAHLPLRVAMRPAE